MDSNEQLVIDALAALDELHDRMMADREALDQKLADIEAKQAKYRKLLNTSAPKSNGQRRRNPRGFNEARVLKAIQDAEQNGHGLGAMEIRTNTGLSWSSVRQTLEKHPELFEKGNDGKWYTHKRSPERTQGL